MKLSAVVFDMAGTTVDEDNVVYKTLQFSLNHFGFPVHLDEVLLYGAGKEKFQAIHDIIASTYVQVELSLQQEIFEFFQVALSKAYEEFEVKPMAGAEELFDWLKKNNIYVVLNTGYDRKTAERLLKKLGWTIGVTIDLLVTATDVAKNRPHPDMIDHARKKLGLSGADRLVKIGDSCIDIEEGKNGGCISLGITTGAQTREQLAWANPDHIIDHLSEVPQLSFFHLLG